ncbi:MAG: DUF4935 domain-containing protein [Acidobacteria bacterium]|nr:DUF4935 domain-containing protein [Acidobacteriota bacterium]
MKRSLPSYYSPSEDEIRKVWAAGLIVLDANILLNLYRYPQQARDGLFNTLEKLSGRLWIPHQVALEYQRNRPAAIMEQRRRFSEVRKILEETGLSLKREFDKLQLAKRHSSIDAQPFIDEVDSAIDRFKHRLDQLERQQLDVSDFDPIRAKLDAILEGRVGEPPESQDYLDGIFAEGKERYAVLRPPGFLDTKTDSCYSWNGLMYQGRYGDLIVWKQIISKAKADRPVGVLFVTDDEKNDWWWTVDSGGRKKLGPRPELIEELSTEAETTLFLLYTARRFLERTPEFLNVEVPGDAITQLRDLAAVRPEVTAYSILTNSQLKQRSLEIVAQIRTGLRLYRDESDRADYFTSVDRAVSEEERCAAWDQMIYASDQASSRLMADYEMNWKVEALLLSDEIRRRLSIEPERNVQFRYEHPTNPLGIEAVVTDLERLARTLPEL